MSKHVRNSFDVIAPTARQAQIEAQSLALQQANKTPRSRILCIGQRVIMEAPGVCLTYHFRAG